MAGGRHISMIFSNCSLNVDGKMKTTTCYLAKAEWARKPFTEVGFNLLFQK